VTRAERRAKERGKADRAGRCVTCITRPTKPGNKTCDKCQSDARERSTKRRRKAGVGQRVSRQPARATPLRELFRVERLGGKFARWHLDAAFKDDEPVMDGYHVEHCGHPTANRPYVGYTPDGSAILTPNRLGFRLLADAQLAVVARALADRGP
jgi:hypothetical protein